MNEKKRSMASIDLAATGRRVFELREKAGLSVADLQQQMGLASPQAIYRWQRGETLPTIDNLVALSSILGVPIDEILVVEVPEGRK